jgi:hypothetical protein
MEKLIYKQGLVWDGDAYLLNDYTVKIQMFMIDGGVLSLTLYLN